MEVVEGIAWAGCLTVLVSESGTGKTFLQLDLAGAVSDGVTWHGRATVQGSIAYLSFEGDALGVRQARIGAAGGQQLGERPFAVDRHQLIAEFVRGGVQRDREHRRRLLAPARDHRHDARGRERDAPAAEAEPLIVHGDEHRVAQIISNLLSNSARFTPPGGKIQLMAAQTGDAVVIRVSDTGPGIPAEMQQRIFEMFAQLNRTMENGSSGLGIGLTLVKTLVEMHGGTICVANNSPEPGAEFTIELAACQAPSASPVELAS